MSREVPKANKSVTRFERDVYMSLGHIDIPLRCKLGQ